MSLNKAKLASLSDKLVEVESREVPTDVPVEEAVRAEEAGVRKEIKKVKNGK